MFGIIPCLLRDITTYLLENLSKESPLFYYMEVSVVFIVRLVMPTLCPTNQTPVLRQNKN
jgi:hypothetical protein